MGMLPPRFPKIAKQRLREYGRHAPAVSLLIGLGTLAGVYGAARASGHIPSGMWWPFISFLGFRAPERVIYVCGFTATAAGIVVAAVFADQTLLCLVEPQHRRLATLSYNAALVAAVGLVGQAVIPLQPNVDDVISGQAPVTAQSLVHQSCAGVLFLAGYVHAISMDLLLIKSRTLPSTARSRAVKCALTLGMLAPIWHGLVRHPTRSSPGKHALTLDEMSWGAVGQWLGVLSLLAYFASYHVEFTHPLAAQKKSLCVSTAPRSVEEMRDAGTRAAGAGGAPCGSASSPALCGDLQGDAEQSDMERLLPTS